jgi:hypothetical protein
LILINPALRICHSIVANLNLKSLPEPVIDRNVEFEAASTIRGSR